VASPEAPSDAAARETVLDWQIEAVEKLEGELSQAVGALGREDPHPSGFAGPAFLDVLIRRAHADGAGAFLARGLSEDGGLAALWPLERSAGGELRLLQHRQGDHATCLARADVGIDALADGLRQALAQTDARGIHLANVPPWGPTLAAARVAMARAGWAHRAFPATPCPVLAVESGEERGERLTAEIERHRRVRSYTNRLKREPSFAFDVLEDDAGLAGWATAFADVHELRWNHTVTPSEFCDPERRAFLADCLEGWARDGALVRFSISVDAKPISLAAAVRSGERLVYHLVTTAPDGDRFRAGHVLIRLIGLWMAEHGFSVLDFGEGDEGYKLRYANRDDRLWRLHGARSRVSKRLLAGHLEERLRGSEVAQERWDRIANQWLRGAALHSLRTLRRRVAGSLRIYRSAPWNVRWGMLRDKLGQRREILYFARGRGGPGDTGVTDLAPIEALRLMEAEQGVLASGRADWLKLAREGARAVGVVEEGRAVALCWLARASQVVAEFPDPPTGKAEDAWVLFGAVTAAPARGRGLYPRILEHLLRAVPEGDPVWMHTDTWNEASRRGIERAGFRPVGVRVLPRGGEPRFEPWPHP